MTPSLSAVSAGPPLPTEEQTDEFNIEDYLLNRPETSFYIRVNGDSMDGRGIHDGDILVVDKSIEPHQGSVVVAQLDGSFTLKTYDCTTGHLRLVPANRAYSSVEASEDARLCGVATFLIHRL